MRLWGGREGSEIDMGEKSASLVPSSNVLYTHTGTGRTTDGDRRGKLTAQ